jgi:hypothetical protein
MHSRGQVMGRRYWCDVSLWPPYLSFALGSAHVHIHPWHLQMQWRSCGYTATVGAGTASLLVWCGKREWWPYWVYRRLPDSE